MRPPVHLDFERPRARSGLLGAALLASGVVALGTTLLLYRADRQRQAGVELRLANLELLAHRSPGDAALDAAANEARQRALRALSAPWTRLLAELEHASADTAGKVSLLSIEPDESKKIVHIEGEAKNLALAIAYVERLQQSRSLRDPMLDRHEVRTDDAEHPVRFELTGEWRGMP